MWHLNSGLGFVTAIIRHAVGTWNSRRNRAETSPLAYLENAQIYCLECKLISASCAVAFLLIDFPIGIYQYRKRDFRRSVRSNLQSIWLAVSFQND
jgi:hypothetical protein